MSKTKPNIMIVGQCDFFSQAICHTIETTLEVNVTHCDSISKLINIVNDNCNIATTILCCEHLLHDNNDHDKCSAIHEYMPLMPILGVVKEAPTKDHLKRCYEAGIVDHIIKPSDEADVDMIICKLKAFVETFRYKVKLEEEIENNAIIHAKNLKNMTAYIDLLNATKIAYMILDKNGVMLEANKTLVELLKCDSDAELIGQRPVEWIPPCDLKLFQEEWDNMLSGSTIDELEVRFLKPCKDNLLNIWVRINGSCLQNGKTKVLLLIKDISTKKNTELRENIEQQKTKDTILQTVSKIRKIISGNKEPLSQKNGKGNQFSK